MQHCLHTTAVEMDILIKRAMGVLTKLHDLPTKAVTFADEPKIFTLDLAFFDGTFFLSRLMGQGVVKKRFIEQRFFMNTDFVERSC